MEIIEKFVKGKKFDQSLCEDGIYVGNNFIAVVDGVTSKANSHAPKTSGRAAMEKIIETIDSLPANIEKDAAFLILNDAVATLYENGEYTYAAANMVMFSKAKNEIWFCGDCQCAVNEKVFTNEKMFDKLVGDIRALVIEIGRIEGLSEDDFIKKDIGREFIWPLLEKEHLLCNTASRFGFEMLDGKDLAVYRTKKIKVHNGDTIVLASDGYPVLCPTLEESEKELQQIIKENPLCDSIKYTSTKGIQPNSESFDDRAYIKFII